MLDHRRFRLPRVTRCIFCGAKADSREHAWPDWTLRRLANPSLRIDAHVEGEPLIVDPLQRQLRIKCVCRTCNTGWMKNLEDAVRPIALPMMSDLSIPLSVSDQYTLTRWALKTAMVFEYAKPHKIFYTEAQRFALKAGQIPANTNIWLARYDGLDALNGGGDEVSTVEDTPVRAYVTTLAFGRLALQIATLDQAPVRVDTDLEQFPRDMLVEVWPAARPVVWPPPRSIQEGKLPAFNRRIRSVRRLVVRKL